MKDKLLLETNGVCDSASQVKMAFLRVKLTLSKIIVPVMKRMSEKMVYCQGFLLFGIMKVKEGKLTHRFELCNFVND